MDYQDINAKTIDSWIEGGWESASRRMEGASDTC